MFSIRNQLQRKSRGKVQCFLWKCVFNNCLMFVFIEKLAKQINASFAFWRPCMLRQGVERLYRLTTQRSSRLSLSISKLATSSGPHPFRISNLFWSAHQESVGPTKLDTHLLVSQSGSLNMKWQFTNLQWKIQLLINPDFSSWLDQSLFSF